jgi:hypothetical protein
MLAPRDQVDLLIGLGQSLYLADNFGAAAELFDVALSRAALLEERDRLMLLDWWATTLDRDAQARSADRRPRVFERITCAWRGAAARIGSAPATTGWRSPREAPVIWTARGRCGRRVGPRRPVSRDRRSAARRSRPTRHQALIPERVRTRRCAIRPTPPTRSAPSGRPSSRSGRAGSKFINRR